MRRHPDYAETAPLPCPPPAFTARSLCGMTMARRRVIARALAPIFMLLSGGVDLYRCYEVDEFAAWLRTDGVLGERLRPCPWGCTGAERCPGSFGLIGGQEVPDCKGKAVMPARERKARR